MANKTSAALLAAIVSMAGPALAQETAPAKESMETTAQQAADSASDAANDAAAAMTKAADDAAAAVEGAAKDATDAMKAATMDATDDTSADAAEDATADEAATDDATADMAADAKAEMDEAPAEDMAEDMAAETAAPEAEAEATPAEMQVGTYYVKSTHGDWTLRCIKAEEGQPDPCELYQLLKDDQGNSVAEVTLIPLAQGEAAAGATIVAPLETDLVRGLGLQIDNSAPRGYPFNFCAPVGCVSRMGFDNGGLNSLKRGNVAKVSLLPFGGDPKNPVELSMSLTGFTAAFTELEGLVEEALSQADAAEAEPAGN